MVDTPGSELRNAKLGGAEAKLKLGIYAFAAALLLSLVAGVATGNYQAFIFFLVLLACIVVSWLWSVLVDRFFHRFRDWNKSHAPQPVSGIQRAPRAPARHPLRQVQTGPAALSLQGLIQSGGIPYAVASAESSNPMERTAALKMQAADTLAKLARELEDLGKGAEAAAVWQEVLAYDPLNAHAGEKAREAVPERAADAVSSALNLLRAGRLDEARPALEALKDKNASGAVLYGLAMCQAQAGESAAAVETFRNAASAGADSVWLRLAMGLGYAETGDQDNATKQLRAATVMDDGIAPVHAALAELELSGGEVDAAMESAQEAVNLDSDLAMGRAALGRALYQKSDTAGAAREFARALEKDPDNPDLLYNYAAALAASEKWDDLLREVAPRADRANDPQVFQLVGQAYEKKGQTDKAREYLSRTAELMPESEGARIAVVRSLREEGRLDEARTAVEELLRSNPKSAEAMTEMGLVTEAQGDSGKALEHYRAAVQLDRTSASASTNAGRLLVQGGQLRDGLNLLKQAQGLPGADAQTHYWLGEAQLRTGKPLVALESLRQASQLSSDRKPEISYALGRAYLQSGRAKDAVDELRRTRKLDPSNPEVDRDLGYAHYKMRNYSEALKLLREYLNRMPDAGDADEVRRLITELSKG